MIVRHCIRCAFGVLSVSVMTACYTVTPETLSQEIANAAITAVVKTRIVTDPRSPLGLVDIETIENRVYLTGVVATEEDKTRAHTLALETPGVSSVVNKLHVDEQQARAALQASLAPAHPL
jgi:hyperosmotically inducible periplasmic protein